MDKAEYDALLDAVADYARGGMPRPKGLMGDPQAFLKGAQEYGATPEGQEAARKERGSEVRTHLRLKVDSYSGGLASLIRPKTEGQSTGIAFTPETLARCAIEGGLTGRKAANRIERFKEAASRMERLAERMEARQQEENTIRRLK